MAAALSLNQFSPDLNASQQRRLAQGEVVLNGPAIQPLAWVICRQHTMSPWGTGL